MSAIKDLRDLVNVSRLTFREDDNEEDDYNNNFTPRGQSPAPTVKPALFKTPLIKSNGEPRVKSKKDETSSKKKPFVLNSHNLVDSPRSSLVLADRSSLVDRSVVPEVHVINNSDSMASFKSQDDENRDSPLNEKNKLNKSIEPLKDAAMSVSGPNPTKSLTNQLNGNFDYMLTYIDASVVSEWLNRANRYLKKLSAWHRGGGGEEDSLKYESFIRFCSFWIGSSPKFSDKQRRELIEFEYSIIYDEVVHAFQCGIDSHQITIGDLHGLLRAVFREYPLQLLSFRGTYLLLDYIDTLSSERQDDYKRLLSDVKCRTVNKQYAQWLLSIRSFALINLCWSIVKFYKKAVQQEKEEQRQQSKRAVSSTDREKLEGEKPEEKIESEVKDNQPKRNNLSSAKSNEFKRTTELDSSSSDSSSSGSSISSSRRAMSVKSSNNSLLDSYPIISKEMKYEMYLKAVLKNDFPDVLHYFISMKKFDPYQKDQQGRTLVFLAVMNEKPKILTYLVKRCPSINLNEICDSGNTALHAAVNKGNTCLVEILLRANEDSASSSSSSENTNNSQENSSNKTKTPTTTKRPRLDVNKPNTKCMNATALHLAVWNNYNEIALRLIEAKADPMLKMNGRSTAFDLARENSNSVLVDLMREFAKRYLGVSYASDNDDNNDNEKSNQSPPN